MTYNEFLKRVRKKLNITQEQLARDLNVSFSTLNRWENNRNIPSQLARMRLIEYCTEKGIPSEIITEMRHAKSIKGTGEMAYNDNNQ